MILLSLFLFAAELNFSSSVDRTTVGLGETFTLNVTVSGENVGSVPTPQLPELPDFNVIGRSSSQSTNISFVNGKMTQQGTVNFIYTLSPKKLGEFTIGPCTMKYGDQTYETQAVQVEVIKGTTQAPQSQQSQPGQPGQRTPAPPSGTVQGNLMIFGNVNRRTVFLGEQVNVEYTMYTRYEVADIGLAKIGNFSGCWSENIFEASRFNYQRKVYEGKTYDAMLLKKIALFPLNAGEIMIGPMSVPVSVVDRDFFGFVVSAQDVAVEVQPLKLNVQPLPEEGKPPEFCGGVGNFTVSAKLDRDSSANGEPINLIVKVSGTGNIPLVEKPELPEIPNLRVLEPEVADNIQTTGDIIKGTKEFRFPIIPQADGEHVVPEIKIAFFNPKTKSYQMISTEKQRFTASGAAAAGKVVEASGMKVLGTDIRYIKPDAGRLSADRPAAQTLLLVFYLSSLLIIAAAAWYRSHQERMVVDLAYARKARSSKLVRKRLKAAEGHLGKNNMKEFYSSLAKSVLGYIGDRFNIDTQVLTRERITGKLLERGVDSEMAKQVQEILDECDTGCYSPGAVSGKNCRDLLKKAKELLGRL